MKSFESYNDAKELLSEISISSWPHYKIEYLKEIRTLPQANKNKEVDLKMTKNEKRLLLLKFYR